MTKRRKGKLLSGFMAFLIVTIVFRLIVVSLASWQESLGLSGEVSTGDFDVVFSDIRVVPGEERGEGRATVGLSDANRSADIRVYSAEPGYSAVIEYSVENLGTVPASYWMTDNFDVMSPNPSAVSVREVKTPDGVIEGTGGFSTRNYDRTQTGRLRIDVREGLLTLGKPTIIGFSWTWSSNSGTWHADGVDGPYRFGPCGRGEKQA